MPSPQKPQFVDERSNTDKSLSVERDKTTKALDKASLKTRLKTNRILKDERTNADQATAASRINHDDSRHLNQISELEQNHLKEERKETDSATDAERSKIDLAISKEREAATELVAAVLDSERAATDKNLVLERDATDSSVEDSSRELKSEVADHAKTKVSLTTRDEFLAIVSHDLRNPLGAVRSYAEILLNQSKYGHLHPEVKEYIGAIMRNADASLRLISDLLDVERMANDNFHLTFKKNEVKELIRESIETFAKDASDKDIRLSQESWSIDGIIECDHDRIMQVISNLLGNAMKYTPMGGAISIGALITGAELLISVRDSGPGIPDAKKVKIFQRFTQLGTKDRSGLGLGLYISKMLIEAHHGRLWVESESGNGSIFSFTIPMKPKCT